MAFFENLVKLGVGRRPIDDDFFKPNKILSEMSERIAVFQIDLKNVPKVVETMSCSVPGCNAEFNNLSQQESHYNSAHQYTCCECKKNLPSGHLLDLHVAETHDSFFAVMSERTPSYLCYVESCKDKFPDSKTRMTHCIEVHKFPPSFRFDRPKLKTKNKPKKKNKVEKMDVTSRTSSGDTAECDETASSGGSPKRCGPTPHFGRSQVKTFSSKNYFAGGRPKRPGPAPDILESARAFSDLKSSLPDA